MQSFARLPLLNTKITAITDVFPLLGNIFPQPGNFFPWSGKIIPLSGNYLENIGCLLSMNSSMDVRSIIAYI
jgi:hypothetical protein